MKVTPQLILIRAINVVTSIVIAGLGLRFLFRLFGANPNAPFVEFLYGSTAVLLDPFANIFSPYVVDADNIVSVFEFSTLIAMVVYAFVAWLLIELIDYISYSRDSRSV